MTVLDTFYYLFKTDTSEAKRGVAELDAQIAELAKKGSARTEAENKALGAMRKLRSQQTQDYKDQGQAVSSLNGTLLELGATAIAAFAGFEGLKSGIANAIQMNAELGRQHILTGESAKDLAAWDAAFEQTTGNKGEFLNWFNSYSQMLQRMGKDSSQVLPNLRALSNELKALPEDQARTRFQQISAATGLPADFFLLLREGGSALDAIIEKKKEDTGVTDKEAAANLKLASSYTSLKTSIGGLFTKAMSYVAPWIGDRMDEVAEMNTAIAKSPSTVGKALLGEIVAPVTGGAIPLGIRNNNPGNLRSWGGVPSIGGFAHFGSLAAGVAAEERQLELYGKRGINTLRGIISKWAPASENDTGAYIKALQKATGFGADDALDLSNPAVRHAVANGINAHENGGTYGHMIATAQDAVKVADASAFNGVAGMSSTSSQSITIGQVHVNTQATDAKGISQAIKGYLNDQFRTTVAHHDDGVAR